MDQESYIRITAETAVKLREQLRSLGNEFHLTFARAAVGAAEKMAKKPDDSFDWIRNDPEGGLAFIISVWHFMEEFAEKKTGVPRTTQSKETHDAVGEFSLIYASIIFDVYNQLSKGSNIIATPETPELNLSEADTNRIENRAGSFFNRYLKPQLIYTDLSKVSPRFG